MARFRPNTTPKMSAPTERSEADRCSFSLLNSLLSASKPLLQGRNLGRVLLPHFVDGRVTLFVESVLQASAEFAFTLVRLRIFFRGRAAVQFDFAIRVDPVDQVLVPGGVALGLRGVGRKRREFGSGHRLRLEIIDIHLHLESIHPTRPACCRLAPARQARYPPRNRPSIFVST